MPKSASISARIDPDLKQQAEAVFTQLGLTASQAITLFYRQVELQHGLPFPIRLPNDTTQQALAQAQSRHELFTASDVDALFADLDD